MTRRLMMSVSQKLASWKGSAEDAKAGKKNQRKTAKLVPEVSAIKYFFVFFVVKNL
jgi:hypothetical protein